MVLAALRSWWSEAVPRGGAGIRVVDHARVGTLGCLVRRNGSVFGLTCEHVLADGRQRVHLQSHTQWARPPRAENHPWQSCGRVLEIGGIDYAQNRADTDSALVSVGPAYTPSIQSIGAIRGDSAIGRYHAVARKLRVQKFGFQTGLTFGRVTAIKDIIIQIRGSDNVVTHRYACPGCLEIEAEDPNKQSFCEPGDSGALVVDAEESGRPRAVGLLCSTVLEYKGYAIPIERVLRAHNTALLGRG